MRRLAIIAGVVAALSLPIAGKTPPRYVPAPSPAPPAGTGSISGAVVAAEAGARPLRLASVVIIGAGTGTLRVKSSDANGRFVFADLPADRYVIGASKSPYLGAVAGARRPARSGTSIALGNGEQIGG